MEIATSRTGSSNENEKIEREILSVSLFHIEDQSKYLYIIYCFVSLSLIFLSSSVLFMYHHSPNDIESLVRRKARPPSLSFVKLWLPNVYTAT